MSHKHGMEAGAAGTAARRPGVVLAMLILVYAFNFLDRQILSILAQPVKADLGFTDTQMGALGGLAFALFYSTMAIPLGVLADRTSRSGIIGISLVVWSMFTALCGMAGNFMQMFLFRLGVGIGEAGGVAPSHALITGSFPPERRARAISIYSLGIPLGTAAGAFFGAAIAQAVNWRVAFIVLGLAGIVAAIPFRMIVRDPPREPGEATPALAVFGRLARMPVFWLLAAGAALGSIPGYGLAFWIPAWLQRSLELDLVTTGRFVGAQALFAGCIGLLAGGYLADRLGRSDRAMFGKLPAIGYALCVPAFAAAFSTSAPMAAFAWLLLPTAFSYVWIGPVVTAVQHLVDPRDRATASACFLLLNNGVGIGLGALVIGRFSDTLTPALGEDALRVAMLWSLAGYALAAVLMLAAAPRLRRAWRD